MGEHERTISLPEVVVRLRADGIVDFDYVVRGQVDLDIARRTVAAGRQLTATPRPTMLRINAVAGVTREARQYFAESPENRAVSSRVAMMGLTPLSRTIGNFFIGFSKPQVPTRLFSDEAEALAWLLAS